MINIPLFLITGMKIEPVQFNQRRFCFKVLYSTLRLNRHQNMPNPPNKMAIMPKIRLKSTLRDVSVSVTGGVPVGAG